MRLVLARSIPSRGIIRGDLDSTDVYIDSTSNSIPSQHDGDKIKDVGFVMIVGRMRTVATQAEKDCSLQDSIL